MEIFVRKGYHGTSILDITRKAGFTKGALYSHFASKGELLLRIIEEYRSRFIDGMIHALEQCSGDALARIHRVISFMAKLALENPELCVFLTFLTMELNGDEDFEPALKRVYLEYRRIITDVISQGIRQGVFKRHLDPQVSALTFIALHDGVLHQWVLNRHRLDGESYVRTFREVFLHGLVNPGVTDWKESQPTQTRPEKGVDE